MKNVLLLIAASMVAACGGGGTSPTLTPDQSTPMVPETDQTQTANQSVQDVVVVGLTDTSALYHNRTTSTSLEQATFDGNTVTLDANTVTKISQAWTLDGGSVDFNGYAGVPTAPEDLPQGTVEFQGQGDGILRLSDETLDTFTSQNLSVTADFSANEVTIAAQDIQGTLHVQTPLVDHVTVTGLGITGSQFAHTDRTEIEMTQNGAAVEFSASAQAQGQFFGQTDTAAGAVVAANDTQHFVLSFTASAD